MKFKDYYSLEENIDTGKSFWILPIGKVVNLDPNKKYYESHNRILHKFAKQYFGLPGLVEDIDKLSLMAFQRGAIRVSSYGQIAAIDGTSDSIIRHMNMLYDVLLSNNIKNVIHPKNRARLGMDTLEDFIDRY